MPEAVIVSTARSPIGRAGKGSLKEMRPDEMATQMVRTALARVPELDPHGSASLIYTGPVVDAAPVVAGRDADPMVLVSWSMR